MWRGSPGSVRDPSMRQKLCWASESLCRSPSMSSPPPRPPPRVMGKMGLDKPVSAQHGPRSWTGLNISYLAMTQERNRSVHARREKEEVWCTCLARVRCFLLVFEGLPCLGVLAKWGGEKSPLGADPKIPSTILTGQFSPLLQWKVNYTVRSPLVVRCCMLRDRNRSWVVLCAFFVVESRLAEKEVTAHTWEALN